MCARIGTKQRRRIPAKLMTPRSANPLRVEQLPQKHPSKESTPDTNTPTSHPVPLPTPVPPIPSLPLPPSPHSLHNDHTPEPPAKIRKSTHHPYDDTTCFKVVHGPTAFDEVRCELRALGAAPKLPRSAVRTTGKLTIALLSQFVHISLALPPLDNVVLLCSGEYLTGAMTLGHLVTHVWPESEGHMVIHYRIATHAFDDDPH